MTEPFNWREHPAADLFPLMSPDELQALADDIKKNGLQAPIVLTWGDTLADPLLLVDGRNRLDALALLGWLTPPRERARHESAKKYKRYVKFHPLSVGDLDDENCFVSEQCFQIADGEPYDLVLSLNVHRRHLTAEQKRELIAKVLKAKPEASDRQIASQVKADHKTVGNVRSGLQSTGEIPQLEKTVGADGKTRKKPALRKNLRAYREIMEEQAKKPIPMDPAGARQAAKTMSPEKARAAALTVLDSVNVDLAKMERAPSADQLVQARFEQFLLMMDKLIADITATNINELSKETIVLLAEGSEKMAAEWKETAEVFRQLIEAKSNDVDTDASAEAMKAKHAARDPPADGSIPDFLDRRGQ